MVIFDCIRLREIDVCPDDIKATPLGLTIVNNGTLSTYSIFEVYGTNRYDCPSNYDRCVVHNYTLYPTIEDFKDAGGIFCGDCGKPIMEEDSYKAFNSFSLCYDYLCESCINDNDYVYIDYECAYYPEDITVRVYTTSYGDFDYILEEDIDNRNAIWCDDEGKYVYDDDAICINDEWYSAWYVSNHFGSCSNCGRHERNDYLNSHNHLCEDCFNNENYDGDLGSEIRNWSFKPVPFFVGEDSKHSYGFELEVTKNTCSTEYNQSMANKLHDIYKYIYFKNDSSTNGGFEIISQPHNEEELFKVPFKEICDALIENNYKSHIGGYCGLHLHIGRNVFGETDSEIIDNSAKMLYFYLKYVDDIKRIARRNKMDYCKLYCEDYLTNRDFCSKIVKGGYLSFDSHHMIVNFANSDTIEVRIMRGTLKLSTLIASLKFIIHIAKRSKEMAWCDVENVDKWLHGIDSDTMEYINSKGGFNNYEEI